MKNIKANNGINIAYPTSLINDEVIEINSTKNVNTQFGIGFINFLEKASIAPDDSAIAKPINDIINVPNGAKLKKLVIALLIISFIPATDSKFSTAINTGSNSFVLVFIVLYVACISKADAIPLNITINIVNNNTVVIG